MHEVRASVQAVTDSLEEQANGNPTKCIKAKCQPCSRAGRVFCSKAAHEPVPRHRNTEWLKSKGPLEVIWSNSHEQAGPPGASCPHPDGLWVSPRQVTLTHNDEIPLSLLEAEYSLLRLSPYFRCSTSLIILDCFQYIHISLVLKASSSAGITSPVLNKRGRITHFSSLLRSLSKAVQPSGVSVNSPTSVSPETCWWYILPHH